ncbi:MAG: GWxTD domain-containing protein [Melioribacteraceae bacterium]
MNKHTFESRNLAYEYFKKAALLEPYNIEYRFAYASLMKDFAKVSAINEFKKIVSIDSMHIPSYLSLAEIKSKDFFEYNNSVRKLSDEFYASLQEYANEDFYEAEKYYRKVLLIDSMNYDANKNLSILYESAGYPEKGIPLLKKLLNKKNDDKDIHLILGLLYYKTSRLKECYNEYQKAISLMNKEEKEDFTFNTVKFLIEPAYKNVIEKMSDRQLNNFIELYWKVYDPLYMTDYNERLLEHYSRVIFSNLHFSVPELGLVGWKTNRGEVVLRYGEPLNFIRIRPSMGENGLMMKTEVWDYKDFSFGFTDMASSGKYLFSTPSYEKEKVHSQFNGNTLDYINYLRKEVHTTYEPKFEGPSFDIDYSIIQFKSMDKWYQTDLYLNYKIDVPDSLFKHNEAVKYKIGLFFFDKYYDEQFRKLDSISVTKSEKNNFINSLAVTTYPDSGFISFEMIREDKGTSSNRLDFEIKKFSNVELGLSDILFSKKITMEKSKGIRRGKFYIEPNPLNQFTKNDTINLYYEVYNLQRNERGICNFEQKISVKKINKKFERGLKKIISSISDFLGITENSEVVIISDYKTLENNPQIILQLDMKNYSSGKYLFTITVKDKVMMKEVSSQTFVDWRN